jgi:hypothetical protein
MSANPLVSILIPSYNYARFLPTAIESVLKQDFADFELLLSDDASSDGSADLIRRYAARDARIRFRIHPANLGLPAHWNWCLRAARGEYVKFMFADDCFTFRYSLGRMLSHLEENPRAVMGATARLIIDENSQPVEVWNPLRQHGLWRGPDVITRCLWHDGNLIGEPSAVIFRRRAAGRCFDLQLRQMVDLEFWFYLLSRGDLAYDPEPLCAFRVHPAQQTVQNRRSFTGPMESLQITARYQDLLGGETGRRLAAFRQKLILHRCLHYSRKRAPRTNEILAAESALHARLPPPWYFFCWAQHRVTKPFDNLMRFWRRRVSRAERAHALPPYLQAWRPPKVNGAAVPPELIASAVGGA